MSARTVAVVLVIDADPQSSASISLVGDEKLKQLIEGGRTIDAFLEDNLTYPTQPIRKHLTDVVCKNVSSTTSNNIPLDISLLPCGTHLRFVEKDKAREFAKGGLGPDAPSLSALNEMMIRSADLVLLPTIPDFISSYGLAAFLHSVWHFPIAKLPKPQRLPYVVISKYQGNLKQHKASAKDLEEEAAMPKPEFAICKTYVPNAVHFAEALAKGDEYPTFTNKWSAKLINDVIWPLTNEIRTVLHAYAP